MRPSTLLAMAGLSLLALGTARAAGPFLAPAATLGVGNLNQVVVRGNYAFCAADEGLAFASQPLSVFGLSDRAHPTVAATWEPPAGYHVRSIVLPDDALSSVLYLLMVYETPGLQDPFSNAGAVLCLDIGNPLAPTEIGRLDLGEAAVLDAFGPLFADGHRLYFWGRGPEGQPRLLVVEALDVAHPTLLADLDLTAYGLTRYSSLSEVRNGVAYLPDQTHALLLDVSNPVAPSVVADYLPPAGWTSVVQVVVSGTRGYMACARPHGTTGPQSRAGSWVNDAEVVVLDVTNPAAPVVHGSYSHDYAFMDVTLAPEDRLLVEVSCTPSDNGLRIVDVSDPDAPTVLSRLASGLRGAWSDTTLATVGGGLWTFDVSDPTTPALLGGYEAAFSARDVAAARGLAFTAETGGRVQVADLTTPSHPQVAGVLLQSFATDSVAASDSLLVAASYPYDDSPFLYVYDLSSGAPVEVAAVPQAAGKLILQGDYLYTGAPSDPYSAGWVLIIDLSDPTTPTLVGSLPASPDPPLADLTLEAVSGPYAYAIGEEYGTPGVTPDRFVVVDVSDPASPHYAGACAVPPSNGFTGSRLGMAVQGHYAFVPSVLGLSAVDVLNPAAPVVVASVEIPGGLLDAALSGSYVVATKGRGLLTDPADFSTFLDSPGAVVLIDISNPLAPQEVSHYEWWGNPGALAVSQGGAYVCEDGRGLWVFKLPRFTDVDAGFWAYDAIGACVEAHIVTGYPDGTYHPEFVVTRGQMAAFISRAMCGGDDLVPTGPAEATFPDVPTDAPFFRHIEYAHAQSIVTGYADGIYQPSWTVNRGQMAAFLARAQCGGDDFVPTGPATASFTDVPPDFGFFRYVEYIYTAGLTTGYSDGTYHPEWACNRGQMAVFIARAFDLLS